ncbi:general stress protein CsbD [Leptolyngbya valderiana BDU 20041]|nr:general stress protein CsbD [Leptolyngbya valderiana BDU 20041]
MNDDQVQGQWDRFTAKVKQEWGDLTDDEVKKAEGNKDELIARIQEKYGDSKETIARKFNELVGERES